jgi:ornithine cyclodeaminase/alanine dehydrogenase-like protein (mu-crystallin family)
LITAIWPVSEDHNVDIEITSSIEAAVQPADLVILASDTQHPLIQADWLKLGVHLTVIEQSYVTPQKLHPEVLKRADVIITDKLSQAGNTGEIHYALAAGAIAHADIQGELSDLIVGNIPGRTHPHQMTVADLIGLDLQDTVVATLALEKALFLGLGQQVESRL